MVVTLSVVMWLVAALWLWLGLHNRRTRRVLEVLGPASPALADGPLVSIVVGARDEADRLLRESIGSFLAQTYANLEVIVVDDQSTDATPAILAELAAADPRLRIVHGRPIEPGWVGKQWAVGQGAAVARGEWLLTTDADVLFAPEAVGVGLATARARGADFLALVPSVTRADLGVNIVAPAGLWVIMMQYPPTVTNDPRDPRAMAVGAYLLYRRAALETVGGHAAIAGCNAEDVSLARTFKRHGFATEVADGSPLVYTPMYHSLPEMWRGSGRNAALPNLRLAWLVLAVALAIGPLPGLVGLVAAVLGAWPVALAGLAAWALAAWSFAPFYRAHHVSTLHGLGAGAGLVFLAAMAFAATCRAGRGGTEWRGRHMGQC
jgi:chlorobactene glucosyltransferase